MSGKLKVALLGCGRAAQHLHLPVLMKLPQVELLAVAEADPERRARVRMICPGASVFESYEELLGEAQPEAVVISLPNNLHAPAATAAFARGLHVYLEKPMATSLAEARALIPAWRASGRRGIIGLNYRFGPMHQDARSAIAAGRIGQIISIQTVFSADARGLPEWKRLRATGGGALLDLASHHFDLVCWFIDSAPVSISCSLRSWSSEDDTAMVQLEFENGVLAHVMASLCAGDNDRLEVYGTQGRLVVDRYRSDRVEWHPKTLHRVRSRRFADAAKALASPTYWLRKVMTSGPEASYWRSLREFAEASLENRSATPDLFDGFRSLALVEAAERASTEARKVAIQSIEPEELLDNESLVG